MLMTHFDRVAVAVHDTVPPTDEEWERWIAYYKMSERSEGRALIESRHGAGPNAKQRKAMAEAIKGRDIRAAVLTESLIVRGIVTAIAWLGIPQRAFPTGQYEEAASFLGFTPDERSRAIDELFKLRAELERISEAPAARATGRR